VVLSIEKTGIPIISPGMCGRDQDRDFDHNGFPAAVAILIHGPVSTGFQDADRIMFELQEAVFVAAELTGVRVKFCGRKHIFACLIQGKLADAVRAVETALKNLPAWECQHHLLPARGEGGFLTIADADALAVAVA